MGYGSVFLFLSWLHVSMFVFWSGLVSVCMFLSGLHVSMYVFEWATCQHICF